MAFTLASVGLGVVGSYWWERQLPRRIEQAAAAGRLDECLRYSEQLSGLSWLPAASPHPQGRCRRDKAAQLWRQERWADALRLQRQLVDSPGATKADRPRLEAWQADLRQIAMLRFQAGDLEGSLAALAPMGEDHRSDGRSMGDGLRQIWNRNRLQHDRADKLARQSRWWEALDALNRIDHPWWQARSRALRRRVEGGLEALKGKDHEHDSHGELPHTVSSERLDALVQKRLAAGMDDGKAFEGACRELGGRIVEAGPESACQR